MSALPAESSAEALREAQAPLPSALAEAALLDPTRRIFTNRTLRFERIRQVGFDMDYTLARYKMRNIEELSYRMTAERLVSVCGYPEAVTRIPYDPSFVVRGLVVDKKRGNIFKMDRHNHVGRVYHGRRPLPKEERYALYRHVKIKLDSKKYHWIDTLFALPEAVLLADVVDLFELELGMKDIDYGKLFDDIRMCIDMVHRDGTLKAIVKADLPRYFDEDPDMPLALHKLRSAGKKLFFLTNSLWDYTQTVMSFLFDGKLHEYPSWRNYFDVVMVGSDKPHFFTEERPFFEVDTKTGLTGTEPVARFERGHVYQGGCIARYEELVGSGGDEILYVGDHIYGDIIRSKKETLWRTALVLEELEDELALIRSHQAAQSELQELEEQRALLEHEINELRLRISAVEHALDGRPSRTVEEVESLAQARRSMRLTFDKKRRDCRAVVTKREALLQQIDQNHNPYWGSAFKEGAEVSRFGRQVEEYACIYTSRASNFRFYSPHQWFRAPRHWMAHEKL